MDILNESKKSIQLARPIVSRATISSKTAKLSWLSRRDDLVNPYDLDEIRPQAQQVFDNIESIYRNWERMNYSDRCGPRQIENYLNGRGYYDGEEMYRLLSSRMETNCSIYENSHHSSFPKDDSTELLNFVMRQGNI